MTGQIRIPATYMRGGTSKGVFFRLEDLPETCRVPGPARATPVENTGGRWQHAPEHRHPPSFGVDHHRLLRSMQQR